MVSRPSPCGNLKISILNVRSFTSTHTRGKKNTLVNRIWLRGVDGRLGAAGSALTLLTDAKLKLCVRVCDRSLCAVARNSESRQWSQTICCSTTWTIFFPALWVRSNGFADLATPAHCTLLSSSTFTRPATASASATTASTAHQQKKTARHIQIRAARRALQAEHHPNKTKTSNGACIQCDILFGVLLRRLRAQFS